MLFESEASTEYRFGPPTQDKYSDEYPGYLPVVCYMERCVHGILLPNFVTFEYVRSSIKMSVVHHQRREEKNTLNGTSTTIRDSSQTWMWRVFV